MLPFAAFDEISRMSDAGLRWISPVMPEAGVRHFMFACFKFHRYPRFGVIKVTSRHPLGTVTASESTYSYVFAVLKQIINIIAAVHWAEDGGRRVNFHWSVEYPR